MAEQQSSNEAKRGPGSFCIPKASLNALIDAQANTYEICTYLVMARFTDETGMYSSANISAVNRYTGANKMKGGPVDRAITRLKTIHAKEKRMVSNGRSGKSHQMVEQFVDLGPILFDRETWFAKTGEVAPDGPTDRGKILNVLPDFGEALADRIWFGGNLVKGVGNFPQPLKQLKNAGDVAARLLLLLYFINDMEIWGGIRPTGDKHGPWQHYEPVADDIYLFGGARLIRAKAQGTVGPTEMFSRAWHAPDNKAPWWEQHASAKDPVFSALNALESSGLIYEMVLVLNRDSVKKRFGSGGEYSDIPIDAEPLYELDCRTRHGYKPDGETGVGSATANTAGVLGHPVALEGGRFDGTYAAMVRKGHPAMIAGIYRLRFRVANVKNAGVKGTWARIHQNNHDAFELVQQIRRANQLSELTPPWNKGRSFGKTSPDMRTNGSDLAVDNFNSDE